MTPLALLLAISGAPVLTSSVASSTVATSGARDAASVFGARVAQDYAAGGLTETEVFDAVRSLSASKRRSFLQGWRSVSSEEPRVQKMTGTLSAMIESKPRVRAKRRKKKQDSRATWGAHRGPVSFRTAVGLGHVSAPGASGFTFDAEVNIGVVPVRRLLIFAKGQTLLAPEAAVGDSVVLLGFGLGAGVYLPEDFYVALAGGAANLNGASSTALGFTGDVNLVKEWNVGPTTGAQFFLKGLVGLIPDSRDVTAAITLGFGISVN